MKTHRMTYSKLMKTHRIAYLKLKNYITVILRNYVNNETSISGYNGYSEKQETINLSDILSSKFGTCYNGTYVEWDKEGETK